MKTKEELIQDYIDGQLSAGDRVLFEQYREQDVEFRETVALQEELSNILSSRLSKETDADTLRASLANAERTLRSGGAGGGTHTGATKGATGKIRSLLPLLAAACVLLAAALFFFRGEQQSDLYKLPQMRSEVVRGEQTDADQRYEEAVRAFNAGTYGQSTKLLSDLQHEHPEILQYQYYLGLSLIGEEEFAEAVPHLEKLAGGESVFRDESLYYLAIALYRSDRPAEARRCLEAIPETSGMYPEGKRLLESIVR